MKQNKVSIILPECDVGFSLIAVTWIILIMSILAVGILSVALTNRQTAASVEMATQERLLVESTIDIFMHRYFYDEEEQVYRGGQLNLYDQDIDIDVQYESGKFNINRADILLLSALFAATGEEADKAESLAAAIVDWRDTDSVVTEDGAEQDDYKASDLTIGPRNGPFESVGELQYVMGMSPDLFFCVRPLLTVYSLSSEPNLYYASDAVREVFAWAFTNNWAGVAWDDPELFEVQGSVAGADDALAGQSLRLIVSPSDNPSKQFSTIVRFGSTSESNVTYRRLVPLRRVVETPPTESCPFS